MAKRPTSHGALWTRKDSVLIRKLVREGNPALKIAKIMGRTLGALYMRASLERIPLSSRSRRAAKR